MRGDGRQREGERVVENNISNCFALVSLDVYTVFLPKKTPMHPAHP